MKNLRMFLTLPASIIQLLFILLLLPFLAAAQPRNLLTGTYSFEALKNSLLAQSKWHPFPSASERTRWEQLPQKLRRAYIAKGEDALKFTWPSVTMTAYLDYVRSGVRDRAEGSANERRQKVLDLVLAECFEGKGRFVEQLAVGIWLICEETSWVIPAHIGEQKAGSGLPDKSEPIIDLFSAETGNLLAWTYYLLGDQLDAVSPLLRKRIKSEIDERILKPGLARDDFWWMWLMPEARPSHHINNWTPWICSNWLAATLILEQRDAERAAAVHKIMRSLDAFMNFYPDDGGCDEGPSYWGHAGGSLFESLELLDGATGGKIDIYKHPLIKGIGQFIHRVHIANSFYVNFGDASAEVDIQAELVQRFGVKIGDEELARLGAATAARRNILETGINGSLTRQLAFLFNLDILKNASSKETLIRDVWLPQSEIMVARAEDNSTKGFFLAAQGGHNEQSHNHNDVGSFVLYSDGKPVLVDVGVETYTAKTFGSERYNIWTMQSAFHNLPTISGVMQKSGKQYAARNVRYQLSKDSVVFSLDIAGAYPGGANVESWNRAFIFDRSRGNVTLTEQFTLGRDPKDLVVSFMTPCMVEQTEAGILTLKAYKAESGTPAQDVILKYDGTALAAQVEIIPLTDRRLKRAWGDTIRRIVLKAINPSQNGGWRYSFEHASAR